METRCELKIELRNERPTNNKYDVRSWEIKKKNGRL